MRIEIIQIIDEKDYRMVSEDQIIFGLGLELLDKLNSEKLVEYSKRMINGKVENKLSIEVSKII